MIKYLLNILIPKKIKYFFCNSIREVELKSTEFINKSYSQEGEDLILKRLLNNKRTGFFVDIGAHHPKRFSNTYLFYLKGWTGINVDPLPGIMEKFKVERPKDINLEIGVSLSDQELDYYMFNEPALNTFSKVEATKKDNIEGYQIVNTVKIKTTPLVEILERHLSRNQKIDFLTIDVEGLDLEVINSNDWEKYRPTYLLVEDLRRQDISIFISESPLYKRLSVLGYIFIAKTFNTLFFKDNRTV